jgi:hypothetical protein
MYVEKRAARPSQRRFYPSKGPGSMFFPSGQLPNAPFSIYNCKKEVQETHQPTAKKRRTAIWRSITKVLARFTKAPMVADISGQGHPGFLTSGTTRGIHPSIARHSSVPHARISTGTANIRKRSVFVTDGLLTPNNF